MLGVGRKRHEELDHRHPLLAEDLVRTILDELRVGGRKLGHRRRIEGALGVGTIGIH